MKKLLLAAVVVGSVVLGVGKAESAPPSATPEKQKPAPTLKVGNPAPALRASKWLQGEEVRKFERDKVYVVEFWATWCGWCILFMPHSADLQAQYKNQRVTFIYYSARDPNSTEEKVTAFVKKRGPKLGYAFAYADERTTYDAWMTAAGRQGIPCAFVVDKNGRIAYIGHPMYLDAVLPMVIADASPKAVSDEARKIDEEFHQIGAIDTAGDDRAGLRVVRDFEAKYPFMANNSVMVRSKLSKLLRLGELDEAKKVAETVVAKAIEHEDPASLSQVCSFLRRDPRKETKDLLAIAVKAAEASARMTGDHDVRALIDLAETYCAAGDHAKAKEVAGKACPLIDDKSPALLINLAEIYCALGSKADAEDCARKVGQTPGDKPVWLLLELAKLYSSMGDKSKSREHLHDAGQAVGDKDERSLIELAKSYSALGDDTESKKYLRKAAEALDGNVWSALYLSQTCCDLGDRAEARKYAGRASQMAESNGPEVLLRLAETYASIGDKTEAKKYARRAVAAAAGEFPAFKLCIREAARKFDDGK